MVAAPEGVQQEQVPQQEGGAWHQTQQHQPEPVVQRVPPAEGGDGGRESVTEASPAMYEALNDACMKQQVKPS